jgi:hypothetical protein
VRVKRLRGDQTLQQRTREAVGAHVLTSLRLKAGVDPTALRHRARSAPCGRLAGRFPLPDRGPLVLSRRRVPRRLRGKPPGDSRLPGAPGRLPRLRLGAVFCDAAGASPPPRHTRPCSLGVVAWAGAAASGLTVHPRWLSRPFVPGPSSLRRALFHSLARQVVSRQTSRDLVVIGVDLVLPAH